MRLRTVVTAVVVFLVTLTVNTTRAQRSTALQPSEADLARGFSETVRPFLDNYCVTCHGGPSPAAQFDLRGYSDVQSVVRDYPRWSLVQEKLHASQMPPAQAKQPEGAARLAVIEWIDRLRKHEAAKNAGDPGVVLARRLSNAEYNYTIRDLTGVDIRPAREFPVDPANPAGFDNSGESLSMSPALLTKYLQAAREVANHLVLKPNGLAFAPHPMLVEIDRDKYCVNQIIDFYRRQATDYAAYFEAAWQFKHRAALGKPKATLAEFAGLKSRATGEMDAARDFLTAVASAKVVSPAISPKYLTTIWRMLEMTKEDVGPLATLQGMWREIPRTATPEVVKASAGRMREFVVQLRKKIELKHTVPEVKGIGDDAQPFLMWRNRQYATSRTSYDRRVLQVEGETTSAQPDPDLAVPAGQRERYEAAFTRFSAVFPDAFYVSERGRYFPDNTRDKGRHLSAGFHNLMGYFRDDLPLYELILDDKQQKQLDAMWQELDFIADATTRTYVQFYLSESGEARKAADPSDARPEGQDITAEPMIQRVAQNYLARGRPSGNPTALKAIEEHFTSTNATIRWVEKARLDAEPIQLQALQEFAARAYRRPLSKAERSDLVAYYRSLRDKTGLNHDDAMRDSIVSVLMSPDFCYRIDLVDGSDAAGPPSLAGRSRASFGEAPQNSRPLSDHALASRLSYFLWSSMPDDELLARAASGDLRRPEVLVAQARRMLKDPRVRGLATEFGGNWLDFRRFEEHNAVDRERFTSFDNDLRQAMFEEPIRFMLDVFGANRSVLDFLYANHTFVNPALAQHYGMPKPAVSHDQWVRVGEATRYGRGGILPMAVFLTKNAPGLRTSPVKRGYWVVKQVLGEHIPPPPAAVPELPRDEAKLDLPLRDLLARHREDKTCASCHARFDALGLVFEGYGPIGEQRVQDLSGRPVDASATFPGGGAGTGVEGLRKYVRERRQSDFVENLSRKLLAYALGRSLLLSDDATVKAMQTNLARDGSRFDSLIATIVASPQFRTKRVATDGIEANADITTRPLQ